MVRAGSIAENAADGDESANDGDGRPVRVPNARAADRDAAAMHCLAPSMNDTPTLSLAGSLLRIQRPLVVVNDDLAIGG